MITPSPSSTTSSLACNLRIDQVEIAKVFHHKLQHHGFLLLKYSSWKLPLDGSRIFLLSIFTVIFECSKSHFQEIYFNAIRDGIP